MAGKILQAAVVGASTLLGKELIGELSESAASLWDLKLLDASDEAEGQLTSAGDEALVIHALGDSSFEGVDVLFFAGARETTMRYVDLALRAGAAVVDLTGALVGRQGFLLRSPWMEQGVARPDLTTVGVVTPEIGALMLAVVVSRLQKNFGVASAVATLLEPASELGAAGVEELHRQTVGLLSFQELPKEVYGTQVAFNVQGTLGEEAVQPIAAKQTRIREESLSLLGETAGPVLRLKLLQAPVFHGYVAPVYIRLQRSATAEEVRSALHGGVLVAEADTAPSNQAATESGDLLVSVEADAGDGQGFWLTLAADNLRLAARNAVGTALELAALRPGARVQ